MTATVWWHFIGHYTFRNANMNMALTWRECQHDNGCRGDIHGDSSHRCLRIYTSKKVSNGDQGQETYSEVGFWLWKKANRRLGQHPGRIHWDDDEEEKEAIATTCLNAYVSEELNRPKKYEKEVCNKLDVIMQEEKSMYMNYQRKGKTCRVHTRWCQYRHWSGKKGMARIQDLPPV